MRMKRVLPLIAVLMLATGCTGAQEPDANAATPGPSETKAPIAACPATADAAPTTRQGLGRGVEMWALLFPTEPQLTANRELKIVFRLTGGQDVTVTANGPGGKEILPVWGPEWHGSSTFDYPGAEFGAGFTFPEAGCWRIRVVNESGVGELALRIAPGPQPS